MTALPVLYSFRRCPFAMRARWALWAAGVVVEHREILLRDKPSAMLHASPKGTVPVLVLPDGHVIDESLDVMRWALAQHDPLGWLQPEQGDEAAMLALIEACQRDFKPHLDRSKYPQRYRIEWAAVADGASGRVAVACGELGAAQAASTAAATAAVPAVADEEVLMQAFVLTHHARAAQFLQGLEARLAQQAALFGSRPALADFAIAPFVRQYAQADVARWEAGVAHGTWSRVNAWFKGLLARPEFEALVMRKHALWPAEHGGNCRA